MGGGHSGENSISGKKGIHFKISAQKGQQGCSQARWDPSSHNSSQEPCSPWRTWPESAGRDTTSIMRQGRGVMSPPFSEQRGVWGARGRASRATCPRLDQHALPGPTTRHPFTSMLVLPRYPLRAEKETRVNASVQHLREATEMGERTKSRKASPSPEARRDWWAGGGEGPARRGF